MNLIGFGISEEVVTEIKGWSQGECFELCFVKHGGHFSLCGWRWSQHCSRGLREGEGGVGRDWTWSVSCIMSGKRYIHKY